MTSMSNTCIAVHLTITATYWKVNLSTHFILVHASPGDAVFKPDLEEQDAPTLHSVVVIIGIPSLP